MKTGLGVISRIWFIRLSLYKGYSLFHRDELGSDKGLS